MCPGRSQSVRAQAGGRGGKERLAEERRKRPRLAAGVRGVVFLMAWRRVSLPGA